MIEDLRQIVIEAGKILTKHFDSSVDVIQKSDHSPQTIADIEADNFLKRNIEDIFKIPVISEESYQGEDIRYDKYFLIDPLDGTQEFINKINEFTISLALMEGNRPVLGIIYAPLLNEIYVAELGKGFKFYGNSIGLENSHNEYDINMVTSRFNNHLGVDKVYDFLNAKSMAKVGSSLKFGRLARGDHNFYLRFQGSKEWDTAAGQLMLEETGFEVIDLVTMEKMSYNKPSAKNNPFLAYHRDLKFNKELLLEYIGKALA